MDRDVAHYFWAVFVKKKTAELEPQGFPNEKVKCKSINRSQINQRLPDAPVYLDLVGQFLAAETTKG